MHTNCNSVFNFRLALYVYEYLLHVGAQKAAQTFLNEVRSHLEMRMKLKVSMKMRKAWFPSLTYVHKAWRAAHLMRSAPSGPSAREVALNWVDLQIRWEKNITLGEPPGFLHSWWWWVLVIPIVVLIVVTITAITVITVITTLSQCILGLILRCSWKKRDLRPQQWGQGIPWLCKIGCSWWSSGW